jgi:hypothetical protein
MEGENRDSSLQALENQVGSFKMIKNQIGISLLFLKKGVFQILSISKNP